MRLKRLEILGFKSFADKTKLYFDQGITAIVGPNGCGKSNIADAFRWVLGEQSAKSLRGGKMPDVIFAGTTKRNSLNFAEVTLVLSEVGGQLPIEYDEVAITRRLHRNGESEYLINKHLVRLKDVQALFLDSGMGKDAYSVFEQGKIDQVINLSPLERRYIFEEAAGILRFLQRKKEALRKLEQTDVNVSRVKDIHKEVERQIIVLEEQSEKAKQYKQNKSDLEQFEKILLMLKRNSFQAKFKDFEIKIGDQERQISLCTSQMDTHQRELIETKEILQEAEKLLKQELEGVFKIKSDKQLRLKEVETNKERIKECALKEKRWQSELEQIGERRGYRESRRKELLKVQNETEGKFVELECVLDKEKEKAKILEDDLNLQREKQQIKQKELFKLMQAENQWENEIKQLQVRIEASEDRAERLFQRKEQIRHSLDEWHVQSEEKRKMLDGIVNENEKHKEIFLSMEDILEGIGNEIENKQDEIDACYLELSELKARQKALQRLKEDMEGFSTGAKQLLFESSDAKSAFFQKIKGLYEYLMPEKGVESAFFAALKPYSHTLVVEAEADFLQLIQHIQLKNIKDVSILCLETIVKLKNGQQTSSIPGLSTLYGKEIDHPCAKHFLCGVYLSGNNQSVLDLVKMHKGLEIWKSDGAFIDRRSVVFYPSQGEQNIFVREAELKGIQKKIEELENQKQQFEIVLETFHQKKHLIQSERAELDKIIRREEIKRVELNMSIQKLKADHEKISGEEINLTNEWQSVKTLIESLKLALNELKIRAQSAKEAVAQAQKETEALTIELTKFVENVKQRVSSLRQSEVELQEVANFQRKHTHDLHVLEVQDLEGLEREQRLIEEVEIAQALKEEIALKDVEVHTDLKKLEGVLRNAVAICEESEDRVAIKKTALEHIESKISEKREVLKKHEMERHQLKLQLIHCESQIQSIESDLQQRHRIENGEEDILIKGMNETVEQIEKRLRQLRQLVDNAGDINMTSIEEYEKYKTRYQFLNDQLDDLNISKDELIKIIADLDGESRAIFQKTFEQVKANFRKNFQILFSGGEADLEFTECADVLEAGIDIIAKPPGKQMRSIHLLSGGEKCLTAMALLFAIFEVKPAPFCILDEIDAPLDDVNVERFANIVKTFSEICQFIIITHNKHTMAIAHVICGVSMEERGVSKLLSIDFSKNSMPEIASI